MAVSGSSNFNLVTNTIIAKAFGVLGKNSEGRAITARMYEDGRSSLNLLIKTWGTREALWRLTERSVTLIASTASYALTPKPMRIISVRRRVTSGSLDTTLSEMSRQEYYDMPSKTNDSTPISYYYDPQSTAGTLYLWPRPSSTTATAQTLQVTYLRAMDDFDGSADDADLPQEWLQALVWNLANDLETEYPVNDARLAIKIEKRAKELYDALRGWDNETAPIFLIPERRWGGWGPDW